jgi:hypothetical protein
LAQVTGIVTRRLRALVALVVFLGGSALPFVTASHLAFDDDAACGDVTITASNTGARLTAAGPARVAEHCAICHWLRTAGGARAASANVGDVWFQPAELVAASPTEWVAAAAPIERPSRAPPSSL